MGARAKAAAPALVAVLPLLVLLVQQVVHVRDPGVPVGDWPVLELATRATLHGDNLLGPYSRFGPHHPGPLMFVWSAPFYALAGQRFGGLVVAVVLVHVLAAAAVVVIVQRLRGQGAAWVAAAVVLVFTARFGLERFRDPWNPYWVVLPTAVAALAAWGCWERKADAARPGAPTWPLVLLVVAGSVASQSHAGSVPVVAALGTLGLVGVVAGHGRPATATWLRPVVVAAVVGLALWAPALWQQATGDPGNLTELVRQARRPLDAPPSDRVVLHLTATSLSWGRAPLGATFGPLSPADPPLRVGAADAVALATTGTVLATAAVVAIRRRRWATAALPVVAVVGAAAVALAGRRIQGEPWPYLFTTGLGLSLVWWLAVALAAFDAGRSLARRRPTPALPAWAAGSITAALAVVVLVGSLGALDDAGTPFGRRWSTPQVDALVAEARRWCHQPDPVRVLIPEGSAFGEAMALGDALARCGAHPRYEPLWRFMVGDAYTERPGDAERAVATLVLRPTSRRPEPGDVTLLVAEPFALDQRGPAPSPNYATSSTRWGM